jgi:hypothetical protein
MNKELVFKKEMRAFDINVDDIKPDEHIFGAIEEAIIKMRNECLIDRLEVVLNNNLIDIKDKITDNRTILGCRLSYADLSKDVSFIVRQDNEPTYEQLQQENKQMKIQISAREEACDRLESNWNKLKEWVNKHYDYYMNNEDYIGGRLCFTDIKNKMQEIEQ